MDGFTKSVIGLVALVLSAGCSEPGPLAPLAQADALMGWYGGEGDGGVEANRLTVPASLHATAAGMRYWYERGGFGAVAGAPYDGLTCAGCHVADTEPESCGGCHDSPLGGRGTVRQETCLSCHARQQSEIALGLPDVHRAVGLECWDCHTSAEIHGDGTSYPSMFAPGAMEVACTGCHGVPGTPAHQYHGDRLACVTCHMSTAVTCVNCHFEKELEDRVRVAAGKVHGWQFLGNFRGQVHPLNFQSIEYRGSTFVAWGPYSGHTIVKEGRGCGDCHASSNLADLRDDGRMSVLEWDASSAAFIPAGGVIPVPEDYATALLFDFVALQPDGSRTFVGSGPDASHMLFAEPLTDLQMAALAAPRETHEPLPAGPPLCDGRPATIWVGMPPAALPAGARITGTDTAHDDDGHDGGCTGDGSQPVRWIIVGTDGDDVIVGSTAPDSIIGLNGDDVICARQARDHVHGGNGHDRLFGGPGADRLYGENGDDLLEGGPGWDLIHGGRGGDRLFGNEGQDSLFGQSGNDQLFGGKSPDFLDGGAGSNLLEYGPEICEGTPGDHGGGDPGGGHDDGSHDDGSCGGDHTDGGCDDGSHDDGGCDDGTHDDGGCDGTDGGCSH